MVGDRERIKEGKGVGEVIRRPGEALTCRCKSSPCAHCPWAQAHTRGELVTLTHTSGRWTFLPPDWALLPEGEGAVEAQATGSPEIGAQGMNNEAASLGAVMIILQEFKNQYASDRASDRARIECSATAHAPCN